MVALCSLLSEEDVRPKNRAHSFAPPCCLHSLAIVLATPLQSRREDVEEGEAAPGAQRTSATTQLPLAGRLWLRPRKDAWFSIYSAATAACEDRHLFLARSLQTAGRA